MRPFANEARPLVNLLSIHIAGQLREYFVNSISKVGLGSPGSETIVSTLLLVAFNLRGVQTGKTGEIPYFSIPSTSNHQKSAAGTGFEKSGRGELYGCA